MDGVLLAADDKYEAGCGLGDVGCIMDEAIVRFFMDMMQWIIDVLTWALDLGSVTSDSSYWDNAVTISAFWLGITSAAGVILVGIIAVTKGAVKQRREEIMRGVLGVAFSVPACLVSIWIVGTGLDIVDTTTKPILELALGGEDMSVALFNFLVPVSGDEVQAWQAGELNAQEQGEAYADAMAAQAAPSLFLIILVLVLLAALVVIAINIIRNIMLQILIAAAPLAFVMLPVGVGKEIILSWAKLTAMILLMKPLMVMYVAMMLGGLLRSGAGFWEMEGLPYAIGLVMVIIVPFAVFAMFNFFGLDNDAGGRETLGAGGRLGGRGMNIVRGGGGGRGGGRGARAGAGSTNAGSSGTSSGGGSSLAARGRHDASSPASSTSRTTTGKPTPSVTPPAGKGGLDKRAAANSTTTTSPTKES
ncbi:hypothetical protein [Gulosibacter sediminis]|uniref:hypothetical protein n=1 Tax=Gulosibacter sediminis TaxID=1729695 RepID=UPI0024A90E38|nr:hypothetical protein [Gulosibacter sediminis]